MERLDLSCIPQPLLEHYDHLLVADPRHYALGKKDGHYVRVKEPYTPKIRERILRGEMSVSLYMLTPGGQAIQGVLDSDHVDGLFQLQEVGRKLKQLGLAPLLEASSRGGHLRIFHEPMDPVVTTQLLSKMLTLCAIEGIEVFPKGRGLSCVRAVLSRHPKTGLQYPLLDMETLNPVDSTIEGQLEYLALFRRATAQVIAEVLAKALAEGERPKFESSPNHGAVNVGERPDILEVVSRDRVVRKVGHYYKALCPFHNDRNPSLVIYPQTQTFYCFGCNVSGDAIQYLARRQGQDL